MGYRGRVSFKMYLPSKPAKYGVKIWALCDSKNAYLLNAQIYCGKEGPTTDIGQGTRVVKELTQPFLNHGRTIITDNFFSTIDLAKYLKTKKTTFVGTVRRNRKFLPPSFQTKKIPKNEREYLFEDDVTLLRFGQKKNKPVLMMPTLHREIDTSITKVPEIIEYYNKIKEGWTC